MYIREQVFAVYNPERLFLIQALFSANMANVTLSDSL